MIKEKIICLNCLTVKRVEMRGNWYRFFIHPKVTVIHITGKLKLPQLLHNYQHFVVLNKLSSSSTAQKGDTTFLFQENFEEKILELQDNYHLEEAKEIKATAWLQLVFVNCNKIGGIASYFKYKLSNTSFSVPVYKSHMSLYTFQL